MESPEGGTDRRELLGGVLGLLASTSLLAGAAPPALARDYTSRSEALDSLDALASICRERLRAVGQARPNAGLLVSRFLARLEEHRLNREQVRRRLVAGPGAEGRGPTASRASEERAEASLIGLRQALDDLMIAYAESLPVFGDATAVSTLAVSMVDVSRLRTVIDLWVVAEEP